MKWNEIVYIHVHLLGYTNLENLDAEPNLWMKRVEIKVHRFFFHSPKLDN